MDYFFLGDEEIVTAFRFIGIGGIAVKDAQEAIAAFKDITEGGNENSAGCKILIMTEDTADSLGDLAVEWQLSGLYPLLVEIPGISGRREDRKTLVDAIRQAIGIHV
ncbi:MAG: ATPase V [Treponema sp.]|nr:ATPase V [Treponema sp.]